MSAFNLARNDATIHRRTCHHWLTARMRGSRLATPWNWPDQFDTLLDAYIATPPWLKPCKTCDPFGLDDA